MVAKWYFVDQGQQRGPFSSDQLKQFAASGRLQPSDLVWKEGMDQWVTASNIKGLCSTASEAQASRLPPPTPGCQSPLGASRQEHSMPDTASTQGQRKVLWTVLGVIGGVAVLLVAFLLVMAIVPPATRAARHQSATTKSDGGPSADTTISGIHVVSQYGLGGERPSLTTLDNEAVAQAIERWCPTEVAESQFVCEVQPQPMGGREVDWSKLEKTLYEMRGAVVTVESHQITEADKLNELEWKGRLYLKGKVVRGRYLMVLWPQKEPDTAWGEWQNEFAVSFVDCERRNGAWNVEVHSAVTPTLIVKYEKIDPADIPR